MADTDPSIHAGMRSTCRTIRREFNHELMKDIEQEFDNYRDYLEERHYGVKQVIISYKTEDVSPDVLRNAEFDLNRVSMFYMDWVQTTMTLQAVTTVHMVLIRYDNIPDEFRHMSLRPRTWRGQITEFFENLENYEQP
ncbi:hypothetical protein PTT_08924 [Pyrenophora teres f. teres 0-1]|uniref:Uncharacterized protein n=2 Tax=Pyrenophora teres f. teres TaxID=97479 RepID=E3RKX0_PYRTT|nr:hypothetical protein PTT_08924 [Pyrenophora teres f. teres 0-1]